MRRFALLAAALLSTAAACGPLPVEPAAAPNAQGDYRLDRANQVAMPGTLDFADGTSFTYHPGTHLSLNGGRYEMVLDYTARDANGEYPWVFKMAGDYVMRGDTVVLDPNGGDWSGQRATVAQNAITLQVGDASRRVREMVFRR
ncbi:MAG: hypothetical protein JWM27_3748 [Gemmatimonadetes bacterium]|nr:hypothetical protein [Gemmatimonadota bacterium]